MERLLDVKEAAKILNVAEMTVRRWTNAGLLRCYRVGGKRERRFKIEDLQEYLEKGRMPIGESAALGFGGLTAPDGSHMTHLSMNYPETLNIGASYVMEGLKNNETVLMVVPANKKNTFLGSLKEQGLAVDDLQKRENLILSEGMDNPAAMASYISRIASDSQGRFRVFGNMTWATSKGWSLEALRNLEEATNALPSSAKKLFLCQYDLESFSGTTAMMAVETHGYTIYRGEIRESPYFNKNILKGQR